MSDLDEIDVASPCPERWEDMRGDDTVRFCGGCEQNVYRLTDMSQREAEDLVLRVQGGERVCIRFQRRQDGTILTRGCPSTRRRQRVETWAKVRTVAAAVAGVVGATLSTGCFEADATAQPPGQPPQATKSLPIAGAVKTASGAPTQTGPAKTAPATPEIEPATPAKCASDIVDEVGSIREGMVIMGEMIAPPPRRALPANPADEGGQPLPAKPQ